jgi:hypothetical protein
MMRQTVFAFLGVAALACAGWTAASAQNTPLAPPGSGPSNRPPAVGRGIATPSRGLRPTPKQCFWRNAQAGGPFGASGTCPAASSAAVGSRCHCWGGRPPRTGTIISIPITRGPPPVVR